MGTTEEILGWRGMDLLDRDGDKIGTIDEIYEDIDSGKPEWALVHTGLFGTKKTFVPLREASPRGDGVTVPFEKEQVKDAPRVDPDGDLSREEERTLYSHYGMDYGSAGAGMGAGAGTGTGQAEGAGFGGAPPVGRDVSGPTTDNAMTRSEEELDVGTTREATGTARLRKYVVTENVQTTVPVEREELRVEREPITDANAGKAMAGPAISEEEHEVTLHEERPVVSKQTVPKERVRLDKETVIDEQQVSEDVRKERIDVEGDDPNRRL